MNSKLLTKQESDDDVQITKKEGRGGEICEGSHGALWIRRSKNSWNHYLDNVVVIRSRVENRENYLFTCNLHTEEKWHLKEKRWGLIWVQRTGILGHV